MPFDIYGCANGDMDEGEKNMTERHSLRNKSKL